MLGLFRDKYADFTVKHFHEQLQKRHGYVPGYTVTKLALHTAGLVRKAAKRSAHRKKRSRRPLPALVPGHMAGMLVMKRWQLQPHGVSSSRQTGPGARPGQRDFAIPRRDAPGACWNCSL